MGLLGNIFSKKKDNSFDLNSMSDEPSSGMPPSDGMNDPFSQPMNNDTFGSSSQNDTFGGPSPMNPDQGDALGMNPQQPMQQQPYPQPAQQPMQQNQGFNPESLGFERVREKTPQQGTGFEPMGNHQQQINDINLGKDIELISAKLDAIKAELDSMNQRMRRIERMAEGENSNNTPRDKWGY